jgi:glucan-binding YG repeat protein
MQTSWVQSGKTWYYLQSSGAIAIGTVTIGTKAYPPPVDT